MEVLAGGETFLFEGFRLDRRGLCQRDESGAFVPVAIGARALDVLRVLIASTAISSRRTRSWLRSGREPWSRTTT
jgi:hypothetical protein